MKLSFVTILVSIIFAQGFSSPLSSISTSNSNNNNNNDNYSQQIYNHDLKLFGKKRTVVDVIFLFVLLLFNGVI